MFDHHPRTRIYVHSAMERSSSLRAAEGGGWVTTTAHHIQGESKK